MPVKKHHARPRVSSTQTPRVAFWRRVAGSWVGVWTLRLAILFLWTWSIQQFLWPKLYFTGDEPTYLVATLSYIQDGDFNLSNNYRNNDYLQFGFLDQMRPQFTDERSGVVPAEHGTVFPFLIAPAYRTGRVDGVRVFLLAIAFACAALTGAAVDRLTGSRVAGSVAIALLAFAPAWQMHTSRIYPDVIAALGASIVIFLLSRHVTDPDGTAGPIPAFCIGFSVCALPLLYVKYGMLAAPLGLAALWMRGFRKNRAVYAGGAVALSLGVLNFLVFREQGALGGAAGAGAIGGPFAAAHAHLLTTQNFFGRYWAQWFDQHHGVAVYEPYMLLAVWAAVAYLRPAISDRAKLLTGMSAAVLLFTGMHAFWNTGPGWSYPGRYLAAAMPLFCVIVCCWAFRQNRLRKVRLSAVGVGGVIAIAFFVASFASNLQPDFVLEPYKQLFPFYWSSWKSGPNFGSASEFGSLPIFAFLTIALTKGAALFAVRRKDLTHS